MNEPEGVESLNLGAIEAINNLDAARLALRWALERIHSLEMSHAQLAAKAERDTAAKAQAEASYEALKRRISLQSHETEDRDAYYARMNEFVSIRLARQPEAATLAKREIELAREQEKVHQLRLDVERQLASKQQALEAQYARLTASLQVKHEGQLRKLQDDFADRERDLRERSLLSIEVQTAMQRALSAESEARLGKAALEESAKRLEALRTEWEKEKAGLSSTLALWQQKATEASAQAAELHQRLASAQMELNQAAVEANQKAETLLETEVGALLAREAERAQTWRLKQQDFLEREKIWQETIRDWERRCGATERELETLKLELTKAIRRYKDRT